MNYQNLQLALQEAVTEAEQSGHEEYVVRAANHYEVCCLFELFEDFPGYHAEAVVFPDGTIH